MATAADIRAVRAWVGTSPDDPTVEALLDEPLSVAAAALAILEPRLADLVATPPVTALSVDGDASASWSPLTFQGNIAVLRSYIAQLKGIVAAELGVVDPGLPTLTAGQMSRSSPTR